VNKGQEIKLRLRTDRRDGFRKYAAIKKILCHELAHNRYSNHGPDFLELESLLNKEAARLDWKSSGQKLGTSSNRAGMITHKGARNRLWQTPRRKEREEDEETERAPVDKDAIKERKRKEKQNMLDIMSKHMMKMASAAMPSTSSGADTQRGAELTLDEGSEHASSPVVLSESARGASLNSNVASASHDDTLNANAPVAAHIEADCDMSEDVEETPQRIEDANHSMASMGASKTDEPPAADAHESSEGSSSSEVGDTEMGCSPDADAATMRMQKLYGIIQELRGGVAPMAFPLAISLLLKYVTNPVESPETEKYQRIRVQNKVYQQRIKGTAGERFLQAVGFHHILGGEYLALTLDPGVLWIAKSVLQAALVA